MRMGRGFQFVGMAFLFTLAGLQAAASAEDAVKNSERPRLLVLVVFDQLRGDYLIRWEPHFGEGGFRRLLREGAWYQNCHYPYAGTLTGAGHASLLTGCSPDRHGIVANEWPDRTTGASVNCVASRRYQRVPAFPSSLKTSEKGNVSPEQLMAESFGDVLKEATGGQSKIVALSFKDRSAILPGGHKPDACYWLDNASGTFVTSTYYRDELHPWVEQFNQDRPADQWFGKAWDRFRPDLDYDALVGPDDVVGEGSGAKQGRTFPHPMTGGLDKPGSAFYQAVYTSPYGNELLLAMAKRSLDAEGLGTHATPDLLTISFSSNDAVGHAWGPDSQEVFDATLRSDVIIKELLNHLDEKVGKGRYLLALSADHGVCPIPEIAKARGQDAGRVLPNELRQGANQFLEAEFGTGATEKPQWISSLANKWFYLNQATLRDRGVNPAQAAHALAKWLRKQPGIFAAYTTHQLKKGIPEDDALGQRILLSYYPERSGDVLIVLNPYWLPGDYTTGTTHGSHYGYDTHVPLLVYGTGVSPGVRQERVSPTAIAPIFAHAAGVKPPAQSNTPLPGKLFANDHSR